MKVLLADNQSVYRDGLKHNIFKISSDINIIEASSFDQVCDVTKQNNIDLLLIDIDMMKNNWEQNITKLLDDTKPYSIGIMTSDCNNREIQKAKNLNLCCCLPKNIESKDLNDILTKVINGKNYYPSTESSIASKKNKKLTNRQFEVLEYLAQGLSNKQIAYYMNVSEATVKLHINALLRAIEATNRTQAVIKSQKLGII